MNLKETALNFKGKKEITDLEKIPCDVEVKQDTFTGKTGLPVAFSYFEIDGWKYTITNKVLAELQNLFKASPNAKFFKMKKASNGELYAVTLD